MAAVQTVDATGMNNATDPGDSHVRRRKTSSDYGPSYTGLSRLPTEVEERPRLHSDPEDVTAKLGEAEVNEGQHAMIDVKRLSTRTGAVLRELGTDKEGMVSIKDIASAIELGGQHGRNLVFMRRLIVAVVLVAVVIIAGNTMATVITVNMTKDSYAKGHRLVDGEGHILQTASSETMVGAGGVLVVREANSTAVRTDLVESFAQLFDLPRLHLQSLGKVQSIVLLLDSGDEAVFRVSGAIKHRRCAAAATFFVEGGTVVVDADSRLALATIRGKRFVLRGGASRRLAPTRSASARVLKEAQEFFTPANGFEVADVDETGAVASRRLQAGAEMQGWATVMLSSAAGLLDCKESPSKVHRSIFVTGTAMALSGEDEGKELPMRFHYNSWEPGAAKLQVGPSVADYGAGMLFEYNEDGTLAECKSGLRQSDADMQGLLTVNDSVARGSVLMLGEGAEGSGSVLLFVEEYRLDATPAAFLARPPAEACEEATARRPSRTPSMGRRAAQQGGTTMDPVNLWEAAWLGEADLSDNGFTVLRTCEDHNSIARVLQYGAVNILSFPGFDGDVLGDILFALFAKEKNVTGIIVPEGLHDYLLNIEDCINNYLDDNSISLDYIVGHSIGGGVAAIYEALNGRTPAQGVVTFGAVKSRFDTSCTVPGVRYVHPRDPYPGWFRHAEHDITTSRVVSRDLVCARKWWWICVRYKEELSDEPQDCDFTEKNNFYFYGYYGTLVHTQYDRYFVL